MGRPKDNPGDQRAKGYPGKRKKKVDAAIAESERIAKLLATAPVENSQPVAPPVFLKDARIKHALVIWKEYAGKLSRLNLLEETDRYVFAVFCVYMGEFVAANDEILKKGYSVMVKTISKDLMPRENPAVWRRDLAVKVIMELSKRFGLTPLDRFALVRDQAGAADREGADLFRKNSAPPSDEEAVEAGEEDESVIGIMNRLDSARTPARKPN